MELKDKQPFGEMKKNNKSICPRQHTVNSKSKKHAPCGKQEIKVKEKAYIQSLTSGELMYSILSIYINNLC